MKYAIPLKQGLLSSHFGQSTEFILIDTDTQGCILDKETVSTAAHNCGGLPAILAGCGVGVVLAGGMGYTPRKMFEKCSIEVVLGITETNPEKAVMSHIKGTLESGKNVCAHGDTACEHGA